MMLRRIIPVLLFLMCFLTACGHKPSGKTELIYWTGWTGHELEIQKGLVDEFNATHPNIHVKILSLASNSAGAYQKVRIAIAGGDTPDVCSAIWADELASYAMRGALTPLDDFYNKSGRKSDEFMPGVWKMLHYNGHLWGLATTTSATFFAYNKDIFQQAGYSSDWHPKTISDLDKIAWACTTRKPNGSYKRYGYRPGSLLTWGYIFGGKWYDPKTKKITANDPHNVKALEWMASYSKKYDITRMEAFEQSFGNTSSVNGPFFVGKIAMWGTGEWCNEHIKRYAPGLNWGYFPLPAPPNGRYGTTTVGGSVFVIPSACKHKKEAWEFLNWICGPEASKKFCLEISNISPIRQASYSPEFQQDPLFRFAVKLVDSNNSFGPPQCPIWQTYLAEIIRAEDYVIHGKRKPKEMLDDVTVRMQRELDEALQEAVY
jgi:multiple sugar transport system substrate-binding protein